MKNLQDLPTDQLRKMRKTYLAIMLIPFLLLLITLAYVVYLMWKGVIDSNTTIIIIPVVLVGAILPAYIQFGRVSNELKRRRTKEY